jgi:putative hydrolase of the HAD superfamily
MLSNIAPFGADAIRLKFPDLLSSGSGCFMSFEMGYVKPDPEIYRKACRAIGADLKECFFLDDTPECVEGAVKLGMQAMRFSRSTLDDVRKKVRNIIGSGT